MLNSKKCFWIHNHDLSLYVSRYVECVLVTFRERACFDFHPCSVHTIFVIIYIFLIRYRVWLWQAVSNFRRISEFIKFNSQSQPQTVCMQTAAGSLPDTCYQITATVEADTSFLLADLNKIQKAFGQFKTLLLCVFHIFLPRNAGYFKPELEGWSRCLSRCCLSCCIPNHIRLLSAAKQEFTCISIREVEEEEEEKEED